MIADQSLPLQEQDTPGRICVPQLVTMQSAVTPQALALRAGRRKLSYGDLDRWSDQLACRLHALGVGTNVLVGLCLEGSLELVVGALGILKAGGAYVPMDPTYPADRLDFMLGDAGAPVLLTNSALAARLPTGTWQTVLLDVDAAFVAGEESARVDPQLTADDLAYVIYTSGSTGQPKGVEITHGSLLNLITWHRREFAVIPADRATQLASPSFDAAVWELWPYLTAGASIHIPDQETRLDPRRLRDWLVAESITITFLPTPLAERAMILEWPPETALRLLLTGGDTLRRYPPIGLPFTVINNYGPTESTVVTTSGEVPAGAYPGRLPSIGYPIANVQVHILDESMQPVPAGAVGELHVGGEGLARGYLNRPELTADKFVTGHLSGGQTQRLYKTGDLARYLPDGRIEFLGRIDQQVKIRGFRVELGEIEAVLDEHPSVETSVVAAHEDSSDNQLLVAYVVPHEGHDPTPADLRQFLAARLPTHMLPTTFVRLEVLPVSSNGKVDRAALPDPDSISTPAHDSFVAPRTVVEERLTEIIATLLRRDRIGIEDNFFLLGGHSLLGAQVVSRVRDVFGVELSLLRLFEAPTIRELAVEIEDLILAQVEVLSDEEARELLS